MAQTQDTNLTCKDCGQSFVWTASEQEFYKQKGFSAPLRCRDDRAKARQRFNNGGGGGGGGYTGGARQSYAITCANCGQQDTVPFQPRGDKPVLCRNCFRKGDR